MVVRKVASAASALRPERCAQLLRDADAIFPAFAQHASQRPRYRVGGIAAGQKIVGASNAKEVWAYYKVAGHKIVHEETEWTREFPFPWKWSLNYPTFNRAWKGLPILFFKAVQVLVTFEAAARVNGSGNIYTEMDIIPCSYNIDRFNQRLLDKLRSDPDFDVSALSSIGQNDATLLDALVEGECVTRESATGLQKFVKAYLVDHKLSPDWQIGDVRAHPGAKKLGQGKACELEIVDTYTGKTERLATP